MFPTTMNNISDSLTSDESSSIISSCPLSARVHEHSFGTLSSIIMQPHNNSLTTSHHKIITKKKRNLPGNPDPDAEVIALSPATLMATNRFVCEVCNKGFQRDQNLQLHRRGHNLPWKLKQRSGKEIKKRAYVCPEATCLHHHPSRALGDLTGIKKHYCRKHGEKKWKCEKCSKVYAVQSDWKAHSKTCGTREYRCDCGTLFSRKDSFITHRAFCDALAEESARISAATNSIFPPNPNTTTQQYFHFEPQNLHPPPLPPPLHQFSHYNSHISNQWGPPLPQNRLLVHIKHEDHEDTDIINNTTTNNNNMPLISSPLYQNRSQMMMTSVPFGDLHATTSGLPPLSATALLQKAATMGGGAMGQVSSTMAHLDMHVAAASSQWRKRSTGNTDGFTRDFLGLTAGDQCTSTTTASGGAGNMRELLSYTAAYDHNSALKHQSDLFMF
ncbi:hypothetical protein ACP275_04G035500 [Erythranthe tilingii]